MTIETEERPWIRSMSEGSTIHNQLPRQEGVYEWRIPHSQDPTMLVVFLAKMRKRGAAFETVISPEFDHWDGWRILLPKQIEWRMPAEGMEKALTRSYHMLRIEGIEPLPCPFCRTVPRLDGHQELMFGGHMFDGEPYHRNRWELKCCGWAASPRHSNPRVLVDKRNALLAPAPETPPPSDGSGGDGPEVPSPIGPLRSDPPHSSGSKGTSRSTGRKSDKEVTTMQVSLTLASVTTGTTVKGPNAGQKYSVSKGATAHFSNGDKAVTVMAFGAQRDSVAKLLRKGKRVTVTAVWDGKNVLKVLGPQQEAAPAADSAEG